MTLGLELILACIGLALLIFVGVGVLIYRETHKRKDEPYLDQMENPESPTWPPKGRDKEQTK